MADKTKIEWTDATWNPVTGCSVHSAGCTNCYAMKLAGTRLKHVESRKGLTDMTKAGPVWNGQVRFNESEINKPLHWRKPRMIFVCAHGDLFHESVPDEWIDRVFAVMALCPQHTFQVLTKRSDRMREYMESIDNGDGTRISGMRDALVEGAAQKLHHERTGDKSVSEWLSVQLPLPNVWLGVSVEDQKAADERVPDLLQTPAAVRWLSCEPLLGPVVLNRKAYPESHYEDWLRGEAWDGVNGLLNQEIWGQEHGPKLDWIVVGGESGHGARPMHPDWARSLRDQCADAGVPFFFKQHGEWIGLGVRDGKERSNVEGEWPTDTLHMIRLDLGGAKSPKGFPMQRVGKKHAGRLLDGTEHNAMPETHNG